MTWNRSSTVHMHTTAGAHRAVADLRLVLLLLLLLL